jgi:hypothetical protein
VIADTCIRSDSVYAFGMRLRSKTRSNRLSAGSTHYRGSRTCGQNLELVGVLQALDQRDEQFARAEDLLTDLYRQMRDLRWATGYPGAEDKVERMILSSLQLVRSTEELLRRSRQLMKNVDAQCEAGRYRRRM